MNFIYVFTLLLLAPTVFCTKQQVHVAYLGTHKGSQTMQEIEEMHLSYLSSVKQKESEVKASLLYSYKHSINGFAALLTANEADKLSKLQGVASVFESHEYSLHTTRSWEFLRFEGLNNNNIEAHNSSDHFSFGRVFLSKAKYGKDVIVGVMDTGVWPESKSFDDHGMDGIPKSWKGICEATIDFNSSHCNRKIIGARYYAKNFEAKYGKVNPLEDSRSPRDMNGHGTHTASIIAGRAVKDAYALGGFGIGTISGGAPMARLAIYKVCWATPNQSKARGNICLVADMISAIDDAISDGVHVLSISAGSSKPLPYDKDGISIGALHALKNKVIVVCSAGNLGPTLGTVTNLAPWVMTVGASTIDRVFLGPLTLGNGLKITGQSVTPYKLNEMHPLVYAEDVENSGVSIDLKGKCQAGSLSPEKVEGNIVLCASGGWRSEKGAEVNRAGGVGFISGNIVDMKDQLLLETQLVPSLDLTAPDVDTVLSYIRSAKYPTAHIGIAEVSLQYNPAPSVAGVSSRGPNTIDPNIIKPDIAAPGINILASWSEASSPTRVVEDQRFVKYNFNSGSSMAAPHVAAVAALLKAIYPKWSSGAIKSAIMTTSSIGNNMGLLIKDHNGKPATPFEYGSGNLQPSKVVNPGLVYETSTMEYLIYLCSAGYQNSTGSLSLFDLDFKCPNMSIPLYNLNYPSLGLFNIKDVVTVHRIVTNVGNQKSVYSFTGYLPFGIFVQASPMTLIFDRVGQKISFTITVTLSETAKQQRQGSYIFGSYKWTSDHHKVRSPIVLSLA